MEADIKLWVLGSSELYRADLRAENIQGPLENEQRYGRKILLNRVREGIRSRDFFILPLCHRFLSSASGLILKCVGSRGHFQHLVVIFNDVKDRIKVELSQLTS
jgi:hypothetical protein